MSVVMNPANGWQQVLVFEADSDATARVDAFVAGFRPGDDHGACRIQPSLKSPHGYQWYEAYVDFGIGERRAIHLASTLVDALERAELPSYRLVAGKEWLDLAASQRSLEV
ncbi:hypothetical protein [Dokdonella fugitiva]|uniref:Uncharacterized protein n=1 Tax=Dokdonella fugitiva TaxID=328517 RepID=A0A4V2S2G0_9GAMM|nr:hypothetical protein [Dokdonella fugitiva]TCO40290.1 hypothetical protein EV148_10585 [Dokdonella fugitiva]